MKAQRLEHPQGDERRRYKRNLIRLQAIFKSENVTEVSCEIQDFCEGGALITYQGSALGSDALNYLRNQPITLEFSIAANGQNKNFTTTGKAIRITATRIGLAFEENLSKGPFIEALFATTKPDTNPLGTGSATNPNFSARSHSLTERCLEIVNRSLRQIIGQFHRNLEGELSAAADRSKNDFLETAYREAILELKNDREGLEKVICKSVSDQFTGTGDGKNTSLRKLKTQDQIRKLSLVDRNKFEDWLNISEIISRSRILFEKELKELNGKISFVVKQSSGNAINPLAPDYICELFWDEIERYEFDYNIRKTLYKTFETSLNANLGGLYKQLLSLMAGVHPEIYPPGKLKTDTLTAATSLGQSANLTRIQPQGPAPQRKALNDFSRIAHQLIGLERERGNKVSLKNHPDSIGQGQNPGVQEFTKITQCTKDQILAALYFLRNSRRSGDKSIKSGHISESDVIEVLSKGLCGAIKPNLEEQTNLKIASRFFRGVETESYGSPGMQAIMRELELPFLSLAFEDSEFLDSQAHPAKNNLNLLDRISGAVDSNGQLSTKNGQQQLARIFRQFSETPSHRHSEFLEIGNQLEKISDPIEKIRLKNIRRVQEACEGNQKATQSRLYVENLIAKLIGGKNIPKIVVDLLDAGWKQLLILYNIKEGPDNPSQKEAIGVIETLLAWMKEDTDFGDLNDHEIEEVLNFVDSELPTVCTNVQKHMGIMNELTACIVGNGNPKLRKSPEMVFVSEQKVEEEEQHHHHQNALVDPKLGESFHKVRQLKVGDWLLFLSEQNHKEPLNLVWIFDAPPAYVFADRRGIKKRVIPLEKLADLVRKHTAIQVQGPDVPLTDRVTNSILQEMHETLIQRATRDEQTGLVNRKEFIKMLEYELGRVKQFHSVHTLCYLEIDQIMLISNSCALEAGNALLREVTRILTNEIDDASIIARLGDETFAILMKDTSAQEAEAVAARLIKSIGEFQFYWDDKVYSLGSSIGLVPVTERSDGVTGILMHADNTCSAAKTETSNHIQIYTEDDENVKRREQLVDWAGRIGKVLSENRLELRCQLIAPIFPEQNYHSHYEILLSIRDEQGNLIPPDSFIPAAERCNRMIDIDKWVVSNVFNWVEDNKSFFDSIGGFAINLSGQSINSDEFLQFLKREISTRYVVAEKICFEVTETAAVTDLSFAQKFISQIKRYGCSFSLDDFGSGFSSYAYLKNLNVDYLKIDGVFVKDLANSQTDFAMVTSMNEIGHSMGMKTIAEYVEDEFILQKLADIGVDFAQGYGIKKPIFLSDLA